MRRIFIVFFAVLLATSALASAETFTIVLHTGQSISVNGVTVRFLDFSEDGRVAVQVKGTTHVLSYGDTIEVVKGINLTVGSLSFSESSVLLVLYGENISMGEQPSNIQLESRFPSKITQPGEDVVFTVRVRNLGQEGFVPVVVTAPRGGMRKFWPATRKLMGCTSRAARPLRSRLF